MSSARAWVAVALLLATQLAGCERLMRNMYDQPKYPPYARSELFADGAASRPLPPGSVAHATGALAGTSSARFGQAALQQDAIAGQAEQQPFKVTLALLERGRERFGIYCAPCHSPVGDGDGLVTRHGFPHPPSYHTERLRKAPDRHFYDVITQGYGIMHSYADRVSPSDRWAVIAYIRALQLSQNAQLAQLSAELRERLAREAAPPPSPQPAHARAEQAR